MLLADEPTGTLNSHTSLKFIALFQVLNREGTTIVIVTHEPGVVRVTSRLVRIRDGWGLSDVRQHANDAQAELSSFKAETTRGLEAMA